MQAKYFEIGPKKPTKVSAVLYGYDDVKISWNKVTGATGYKIYYKRGTDTQYKLIRTTTATSYSAKNLTDGVKYSFKVITYKTVNKNNCENAGYVKSIYTLKKLSAPTVSKSGTKVKGYKR